MKDTKDDIEGLILVNKPSGITSHDVVDVVRNRLGTKKVGHAGTLDPLADGLMVILVGRYTKLFPKFVEFVKEYLGVLKLGEVTSTGDSQGQIVSTGDYSSIDNEQVQKAFGHFKGEIEQVPPMVSAIRLGGKRLYKLARRGVVVRRDPRKVKIYDLNILKADIPLIEFYVKCSKGTYIRKLAEDVGDKLGCGAHIIKIKRLAIGPFILKEAINLEDINKNHLRMISSKH